MNTHLGWVIVVLTTAACGSVSDPEGECGDGIINGAETCDEGGANGAATSCCTATCQLAPVTAVCRDAVGECDAAETCDGARATCPNDVFVADGSSCTGNGLATCSAADTCTAGVCDDNNEVEGTACGANSCFLETCDEAGVCPAVVAQEIAIIESQSAALSQDMDVRWQAVVESMGHTAAVFPQTHLDNINNLMTADILIVASGVIDVPVARRDTIAAFLASGRGVYTQGEFQATFAGNIIFEALANDQGAGFTWGPEIIGGFNAVPVGCFASTPNPVTALAQNFAVSGAAVATGVETVQINEATSQPIAFSFCRPDGGLIIVRTDQDDIRGGSDNVLNLMRNLIYRLSFSSTCVQ